MNYAAVALVGFVGIAGFTAAIGVRTGAPNERVARYMVIGFAAAAFGAWLANYTAGLAFYGGGACGSLVTAAIFRIIVERAARQHTKSGRTS